MSPLLIFNASTRILLKKSDGEWKLLDWIGNHKNDEFVEKVRLEKTDEWKEIRSEKSKNARDYLDEDEIVFL